MSDEKTKYWKEHLGTIVAVVTALLAAVISLYTFYEQLHTANKHQEINLSRDFAKTFEDKVYRDIRMAIERCQPLYDRYKQGGKFDNDQINTYLDFFDDLGFYLKQDVLTLDVIDHSFGAYAIEAYEYPELRRYVTEFRTGTKQHDAFVEFEYLAKKLEGKPERAQEVKQAQELCKQHATGKNKQP